jgi:proliferating cell nuclear antigen
MTTMSDAGANTDGEAAASDDPDRGEGPIDNLTAIIDTDILETTIEIVDTVAGESVIRFGQGGLDVLLVDSANVYVTELHLDADAFDAIGSGRFPAGLNHQALLDYIGTAGNSQLAELAFQAETARLAIQIEPHNHEFALINPDSIRNQPDTPDLELPNRFEIAGETLQETVDVAQLVSDHLKIHGDLDDECIQFIADGDTDITTTTLDDELEFADVQKDAETILTMEYLQEAVGVIPSSATVEIRFGDEFPVTLDWSYADGHGDVHQIIAPRIQAR